MWWVGFSSFHRLGDLFKITQLLTGRVGTQTFVLGLSDDKALSSLFCLPDSVGSQEQTRVSSLLFSCLAREYFCKRLSQNGLREAVILYGLRVYYVETRRLYLLEPH